MLNTIRVFFSTGITGGLPMSDSPFRTQLTALPLSLTRDNLTQAFTPTGSATCASPPSVSILGGPAPFWDTYSYDTATGNRTGTTVHATTSSGTDATASYSYPTAGSTRPHAVRSVTGASALGAGAYSYDSDGNLTAAPGQALTYNATGKLATDTTASGTQQNIYSATGDLLLQVDPTNGASLYLGDVTLHQTGSGPISGVRTYTAGSGSIPVVERTATAGVTGSTLTWLFTDIDGSVDTQTVASTGATTQRYRDPFGGPLGSTSVWADGNGYLNHPATTSTGLVSLGDRAYNPVLGGFTSVDPVLTTGNPQQINGYTYSGNNPVTFTDPTGDCFEAATDALSHSTNCIGGKSITADSVSTKAYYKQQAYQATPAGIGEHAAAVAMFGMNRALSQINIPLLAWPKAKPGEMTLEQEIELESIDVQQNMLFMNSASEIAPEDAGFIGGAGTLRGVDELGLEAERALTPSLEGGFLSFRAAKRVLPPAGDGNVYDHVVEQSQIGRSGFDPRLIHNPANLNPVPSAINQLKANYYSTIRPFTGGQTVRDWLTGQSYAEQYTFGLDATSLLQRGASLP